MPQVIALQRGALTMSHNTTSLVFTGPSTGTSTRIIVGYLGWNVNTSPSTSIYGHCTFGVLRNGASSPNFSVFAATITGTPTLSMSLSPHDTLTGWNGNSSSTATNSPVFWSNTVGMTRTQSIQVTGGNVGRAMYRSDVMIGPSDAVYCNWFDNGGFGYTAVVQYCFVTVNE